MFGYIEGYTDANTINYCPACGEKITEHFGDGTGKCPKCGIRFGVIEVDEGEDGEK